MNFETFLTDFERAKDKLNKFVVVTFVNAQGSAPQEIGARMIVSELGHFSGTVGGGKLENAAINLAKSALEMESEKTFFRQWNLQTDLGMSCGGVVGLFFEVHHVSATWDLVIFGAGHVAQELVRVLLRLECRVTCVDSREDWLEKLPNSPQLKRVRATPMETFVEELLGHEFVMIMTMGHSTDLPILERILKTKVLPYIGVIGSEVKATKLRAGLSQLGIKEEESRTVYCPMGEPIGNSTPAEIAISIAAQILKIRDVHMGKERKK